MILILIFGIFFFINIITLNDGHNWGDDFAQYIQHAVNLVEHKPYASGISRDLRILCPPGFPFILSSVIYWSGINFKVLKFINVLLWALSALAAYGLALRKLDLFWARMITVWFLTSPIFFFFKQSVLSDIPFMGFIVLALWALMKSEEFQEKGLIDSSRIFLGISVFCVSYSFLIRWAGISLLLAVVVYFFFIKREWQKSLVFIWGAAASWLIAFQCGSLAMGYVDKMTGSLFQTCLLDNWYNLTNAIQSILNLFITDDHFLSQLISPSTSILFNIFAGLLFLGIIGTFFYQLYHRKISLMGCFTFLYLIGAVFWPVKAGRRYFLPVMVPIAILAVSCLKPAWRKFAAIIFLIFILQNIFIIASNFNFNDDDIYNKETLEMVQWVKLHIKPEDHYMFAKPRALGLLTQRIGYNFGGYPRDVQNWYRRVAPLHINYLIMDKRFDQFSRYNNFRLRVDNDDLGINLVWKNDVYKIYNVVLPDNK